MRVCWRSCCGWSAERKREGGGGVREWVCARERECERCVTMHKYVGMHESGRGEWETERGSARACA